MPTNSRPPSTEKNEQKGILFLQTPMGKLCLIEPTTFFAWIENLPVNDRGWKEFRFEDYTKLSRRGLFATVRPLKKVG